MVRSRSRLAGAIATAALAVKVSIIVTRSFTPYSPRHLDIADDKDESLVLEGTGSVDQALLRPRSRGGDPTCQKSTPIER